MSGHFTLDVDPALLRKAARQLDHVRTRTQTHASRVGSTPAEIDGRWTGAAAVSVSGEITALHGHLAALGPLLDSSGTSLSTLASAYDRALEQMDTLNAQWRALDQAYDASVRDAGTAWRTSYDDLKGSDDTSPAAQDTRELDRVLQHAISSAATTRTSGQGQLQATWDQTVQHLRTLTATAGDVLLTRMPVRIPLGYGIPGAGFDASGLLTDLQLTTARLALPQGPLDQAKVDAALKQLQTYLGAIPSDLPWLLSFDHAFGDVLDGLTPAELDAVLAGMDDQQLQRLDTMISLGVLNADTVASLLGANVGADQLQRLYDLCPHLEPKLHGDADGISWTYPAAPLGDPDIGDINQGEVGDCWFLASLAAEIHADPGFVGKHMQVNANGTYTFTFYRDNKPVHITVDGRLPTRDDGSSLPYVHDDPNWGSHGDTWVALYEKAFARFKGGYDAIDGGFGDLGLDALSGGDHDRRDPDDISLTDLRTALDEHRPVTAGSRAHTTGMLWWKEDHNVKLDDQLVISLHEYTVVDVDEKAGVVTLRNPWGSNGYSNEDGAAPEYVRLTMDQLRDNFSEVSM